MTNEKSKEERAEQPDSRATTNEKSKEGKSDVMEKIKILFSKQKLSIILILIVVIVPIIFPHLINFLIIKMQEPSVISETWDEGSQNKTESSVVIDIFVKSINFADGQADIQFSISKGLLKNETTYSHHYYSDSFTLYNSQPENISISFKTYENISVYSYYYYYQYLRPIEIYHFSFSISGPNDIDLMSEEEIYTKIWSLDTSKKFEPMDVDLEDDSESFSININFNMKRSPKSIIYYELFIPIVIFCGICYSGLIATKPLLESTKAIFKQKNNNLDKTSDEFNEKYDNFRKEIEFDRKQRVDMSKWISVFALANIFYENIIPSGSLSIMTFGKIYAISSLVISIAFYGTSKFQGNNKGAKVNVIIAIFSFIMAISALSLVMVRYHQLLDLITGILPFL